MLGTYDFCGHYEWTFAWLEQAGGAALLEEYWDEAINKDSQRHALALIQAKGIAGMKEYWGHSLAQEGAGYRSAATDQAFRLDIHDCPSKGFLLRNGLEQHADYCDHCIGWIGPMLRTAGFAIDHEHNHVGQCWWEMRSLANPETASRPGEWTRDQDVRLRRDWQPEGTTLDRFRRASRVSEKLDQAVNGNAWHALAPLPVASGNFVAGAIDGKLTILGGITWQPGFKQWLDTSWSFDPTASAWIQGRTLPARKAYTAFVQFGDALLLAGGGDGQRTTGIVGLWDSGHGWRELASLSQPRIYSSAALFDGRMFLLGGAPDEADLRTATDEWVAFDPKTRQVEKLPPYPGGPVVLPALTCAGGRLFAFGGASCLASGGVANLDAAFEYSVANRQWRPITPLPMPLRGLAACSLDERHILVAGGYNTEFSASAWIYDTVTDKYRPTRALPYRGMVHLVKMGSDVYCFGGEDRMRHRSRLCYRTTVPLLLA